MLEPAPHTIYGLENMKTECGYMRWPDWDRLALNVTRGDR